MMLTDEQLREIMPASTSANRAKYLPHLNRYMPLYGLSEPDDAARFLAQIGHESGQLRYVEEIASGEKYEGRKDLGNIRAGDGVKFKGRGLIQITGRKNYTALSDAFGHDFINHPEHLTLPEFAVESACWWYQNNVLKKI